MRNGQLQKPVLLELRTRAEVIKQLCSLLCILSACAFPSSKLHDLANKEESLVLHLKQQCKHLLQSQNPRFDKNRRPCSLTTWRLALERELLGHPRLQASFALGFEQVLDSSVPASPLLPFFGSLVKE
jgi:hypothetical protein